MATRKKRSTTAARPEADQGPPADWQALSANSRSFTDLVAAIARDVAYSPPAPPAQYLTGWREILVALGMTDNREDKQKVSRLNKTRGGPIAIPGQGAQPFVGKSKLIQWWNRLASQFATQNRQRDSAATVASQHHYARDGEVVPDIAGGVKKRRRDRKP